LDDILVSEGKAPFFVPRLKEGIDAIGMKDHVSNMLKKVGIDDINNINKAITVPDVVENMSMEERNAFEKDNNGLTVDQFKKAHKYLEESKFKNNSELNKEIVKLIENDPFNKNKK
jgi:hypothetical protein